MKDYKDYIIVLGLQVKPQELIDCLGVIGITVEEWCQYMVEKYPVIKYNHAIGKWFPSRAWDTNESKVVDLNDILKDIKGNHNKSKYFSTIKRDMIDSVYGRHRTNYLKWDITDDLSLRYFFEFQSRPGYVGGFYVKSHKERKYIPVDTQEKLDYVFAHFVKSKESYTHIIGKQQHKKYKKLHVDVNNLYITHNDKIIKHMDI